MFVSRMQGWSQAYLKAPADMSAENISIGPTKVIHLPITMDEPEPEPPADTSVGLDGLGRYERLKWMPQREQERDFREYRSNIGAAVQPTADENMWRQLLSQAGHNF